MCEYRAYRPDCRGTSLPGEFAASRMTSAAAAATRVQAAGSVAASAASSSISGCQRTCMRDRPVAACSRDTAPSAATRAWRAARAGGSASSARVARSSAAAIDVLCQRRAVVSGARIEAAALPLPCGGGGCAAGAPSPAAAAAGVWRGLRAHAPEPCLHAQTQLCLLKSGDFRGGGQRIPLAKPALHGRMARKSVSRSPTGW